MFKFVLYLVESSILQVPVPRRCTPVTHYTSSLVLEFAIVLYHESTCTTNLLFNYALWLLNKLATYWIIQQVLINH